MTTKISLNTQTKDSLAVSKLAVAAAKTILGNPTAGSLAPQYTTDPVVSGAITGNTLVSTVATGTAPLTVASTTVVPNLNAATSASTPASGLTGTTLAAVVVTSSLTSVGSQAQALDMNSHKINNVTDPSAAQDAATKAYVDAVANGLSPKLSVKLATTAALTTNIYNNGSSGVGATLTGVSTGVLTIDGVAVALNDRLWIKNEVAGANNGLYICTTVGALGVAYILTRTSDADTSAELIGAYAFVEAGTTNATTTWAITNSSTITIGTTAITIGQTSGPGTYTNGTGLDLTGNQFSINSTVATLAGAQNLTNKTTTTQSAADNSTKLATTAYADDASSNANVIAKVLTSISTTAAAALLTATDTILSGFSMLNRVITNMSGGLAIFTGASSTAKTYTLPNASCSLLTTNAAVTVAQGGTGVASTTAYGVILGGTTTTGAFQNAGAGTSGQVLTSNGASAAPTFQAVSSPTTFTSSQQTLTAAGSLTLAHSLGAIPNFLTILLVCQTAENNYSIGDKLFVNPGIDTNNQNKGVSVVPDATNLNIRYGSGAGVFAVVDKTTGATAAITAANWKTIFIARL